MVTGIGAAVAEGVSFIAVDGAAGAEAPGQSRPDGSQAFANRPKAATRKISIFMLQCFNASDSWS